MNRACAQQDTLDAPVCQSLGMFVGATNGISFSARIDYERFFGPMCVRGYASFTNESQWMTNDYSVREVEQYREYGVLFGIRAINAWRGYILLCSGISFVHGQVRGEVISKDNIYEMRTLRTIAIPVEAEYGANLTDNIGVYFNPHVVFGAKRVLY
ncbi:MAG TPA: hypothetical protein VIX80_07545, partial [Candidatus Kapabacteria bacterium]